MAKELNGDLGKLILRVSTGGLLIFHGIAKLVHGHEPVRHMLAVNNLPDYLWLGVPIGEIIAPLCLLLGIFTRLSSVIVAFTMFMTIYMTSKIGAVTTFSQTGGLTGEMNLLYLLGALALLFLGAGKYSVYRGNKGLFL
ncbi:MAG: DoxX family protein [Flavobacteriaceae bacterium]|jgi:putative oxidoreductase|nr:DoxX family protein [Flavobacteriaceae bacterium]